MEKYINGENVAEEEVIWLDEEPNRPQDLFEEHEDVRLRSPPGIFYPYNNKNASFSGNHRAVEMEKFVETDTNHWRLLPRELKYWNVGQGREEKKVTPMRL